MDSKKLEILMTAVDLGSFSKASEVVGYTQSGLTHLVDSLEREIGLTLVRRDHIGIALTEEGEALMPAIREFLRTNAKLENRIAAITEKSSCILQYQYAVECRELLVRTVRQHMTGLQEKIRTQSWVSRLHRSCIH